MTKVKKVSRLSRIIEFGMTHLGVDLTAEGQALSNRKIMLCFSNTSIAGLSGEILVKGGCLPPKALEDLEALGLEALEDGVFYGPDTQYVRVRITSEEILEYTRSLKAPSYRREFRSKFIEGVYSYVANVFQHISDEYTKMYIQSHRNEFVFDEMLFQGTSYVTVVPKAKPTSILAKDPVKAMASLAEQVINNHMDVALTIAYGGDWSYATRLGSRSISVKGIDMGGDFGSSRLFEDIDTMLLQVKEISKICEKVTQQNRKLQDRIEAAGGNIKFRRQLARDVLENVVIKAPLYAASEQDLVRSLAKAALMHSI